VRHDDWSSSAAGARRRRDCERRRLARHESISFARLLAYVDRAVSKHVVECRPRKLRGRLDAGRGDAAQIAQ